MFSEEDSSCKEIDMYVKLFLSTCNAFSKEAKNRTKERRIAAKNEENTFFSSTTNFFSLLNVPETVRLHGSVKERWGAVDESYLHRVKDQITVINKSYTYMPTLLTKLLQPQYIVSLNMNN